MWRIELVETFRKAEEKVHLSAGGLALAAVLTAAVGHLLKQGLPELAQVTLEYLHKVLIALDVLIAIMLVIGLVLRAVAIRKPNRLIRRLTRDKLINQHIKRWLTEAKTDLNANHVRFCTESCLEQLNAFNYAAFKDSQFAIELEKLTDRNREWISRHNRIFMFVLDPLAENETVIGYSSMLPLTAEGIKSYLNGALKDADIPPSLVADTFEKTAAVLIFAVHLRREYSANGTTPSRNYTLFFLERVQYHLRELFPGQFTRAFPPLYVQTELSSFETRLTDYGFRTTKRRSADGFDILILERPFGTLAHLDTSGSSLVTSA